MAGAAIRVWELARTLTSSNDVTIAAPRPLPNNAPCALVEARTSVLRKQVSNFDVVITNGARSIEGLGQGQRLVVDLYDPFILENLAWHRQLSMPNRQTIQDYDRALLISQLRLGDYFICASERQRHFWLGMLCALDRVTPEVYDSDPSLRKLIDVVPFGLPIAPPSPKPVLRSRLGLARSDVVVIWGGGIWNWFDPITLIKAAAKVCDDVPALKFVFLGTHHPDPRVAEMAMLSRARDLAGSLRLTGNSVYFLDGWVPYQDRQDYLCDADIGVSLHFDSIETTYSFRTRVLDYLWAGLPLILTRGDEMAELAAADGFGLVVDYEDADGVAAALLRLYENPRLRAKLASQSREVAKRFHWDAAAVPLTRYCADGWQRPMPRAKDEGTKVGSGRRSVYMIKAWRQLRDEGPARLAQRVVRYSRRWL